MSAKPASEVGAARRKWGRWALWLYLALLAASHAWQWRARAQRGVHWSTSVPEGAAGRAVVVDACDDDGPVQGASERESARAGELGRGRCRASFLHWEAAPDAAIGRAPVLLLHGSPGDARNFDALGPELAALGYDTWALDLPGFGGSDGDVPRYSILAHAHFALAALDAIALDRVHLVAWSMGGGVALHMADLAPERVASLALIASLGVQEGEGSGSYHFEHLKYACLYAALVAGPELVPHFGAIGGERGRRSFVRNFWDSDQRPLRAILERTQHPTLILHGARDFLVPLWTARESHRLVSNSRLVILDGSHFLPLGGSYGNLRETSDELGRFLARHDRPAVPEPRELVDRTRPRVGLMQLDFEPYTLALAVPWWLQLAVLALCARAAGVTTGAAAGALVAALQLDFGLASIAVAAGALGARAPWRRKLRQAAIALGALLAAAIGGSIAAALTGAWLPRSLAVLGLALASCVASELVRRLRCARRASPVAA